MSREIACVILGFILGLGIANIFAPTPTPATVDDQLGRSLCFAMGREAAWLKDDPRTFAQQAITHAERTCHVD
jgi:hypothetical protein